MGSRKELSEFGNRILTESRAELYLSMRFFGSALDSLSYVMDLSTRTAGTDAVSIRFNPQFLIRLYLESPRLLNRLYVHMLLHCLLGHMFRADGFENRELYDLCADITAENLLDSMDYPAIAHTDSMFREGWYRKLREEVKMLSAERLYRYFTEYPPDDPEYGRLVREFTKDDHGFWKRMEKEPADGEKGPQMPPPGADGPPPQGAGKDRKEDGKEQKDPESPQKELSAKNGFPVSRELMEKWKKQAERAKVELETSGSKASEEQGSLLRMLRYELKNRRSYKDFLKRFSVISEETRIDMDSFDYAYYQYGMELYGDMPLIEENEYKESKKVRTLVIAIDTSGSCQQVLVQRFLNETADILLSREGFFRHAEVVLLQCDDRVQNEVFLKDPADLKRYAEGFEVRGGFGTDFRPVFRRVEELQKEGKLTNLKGLMYFTDGLGTYPETPPPYEAAFVLFTDEDREEEQHMPSWAYRLYLDGE